MELNLKLMLEYCIQSIYSSSQFEQELQKTFSIFSVYPISVIVSVEFKIVFLITQAHLSIIECGKEVVACGLLIVKM